MLQSNNTTIQDPRFDTHNTTGKFDHPTGKIQIYERSNSMRERYLPVCWIHNENKKTWFSQCDCHSIRTRNNAPLGRTTKDKRRIAQYKLQWSVNTLDRSQKQNLSATHNTIIQGYTK